MTITHDFDETGRFERIVDLDNNRVTIKDHHPDDFHRMGDVHFEINPTLPIYNPDNWRKIINKS